MKPLTELWSRQIPVLKLPAQVAIALFAATIAFHVSALGPAEQRLHALEDAIAKHKPASPLLTVNHSSAPANPAAKLGAFYAFFDRGNTLTDWLARLYDVAERAGVELRQGDYRRTESADVPLVLQEVILPVTGDYVKIRAFAEGTLNTIPVASLDHVSLRRQRANLSQVEAELRFTFYLPQPVQ